MHTTSISWLTYMLVPRSRRPRTILIGDRRPGQLRLAARVRHPYPLLLSVFVARLDLISGRADVLPLPIAVATLACEARGEPRAL